MNARRALATIGWATLIAGVLDFIMPSLGAFLGGSFTQLWQFVASGLLGKAAFSMETAGVLCGILFHFSIMALFSAFAFLVCWKLSIADERWALLTGLVYGAGMWFVMNMLVVPLSRAGSGVVPSFKIEMIMNMGFFGHMILGAVIVLVIRRGMERSL